MSVSKKDIKDISELIRKKLELYMNVERRETRFDPRGRYTTTPKMHKYDFLYKVLDSSVLNSKNRSPRQDKDGQTRPKSSRQSPDRSKSAKRVAERPKSSLVRSSHSPRRDRRQNRRVISPSNEKRRKLEESRSKSGSRKKDVPADRAGKSYPRPDTTMDESSVVSESVQTNASSSVHSRVSSNGIKPRLDDSPSRVVLHREKDRLSTYATKIFSEVPVDEIQLIHRYRPYYEDNGEPKYQGYSRHVGSILKSKNFVQFYNNEALQHSLEKENTDSREKLPPTKRSSKPVPRAIKGRQGTRGHDDVIRTAKSSRHTVFSSLIDTAGTGTRLVKTTSKEFATSSIESLTPTFTSSFHNIDTSTFPPSHDPYRPSETDRPTSPGERFRHGRSVSIASIKSTVTVNFNENKLEEKDRSVSFPIIKQSQEDQMTNERASKKERKSKQAKEYTEYYEDPNTKVKIDREKSNVEITKHETIEKDKQLYNIKQIVVVSVDDKGKEGVKNSAIEKQESIEHIAKNYTESTTETESVDQNEVSDRTLSPISDNELSGTEEIDEKRETVIIAEELRTETEDKSREEKNVTIGDIQIMNAKRHKCLKPLRHSPSPEFIKERKRKRKSVQDITHKSKDEEQKDPIKDNKNSSTVTVAVETDNVETITNNKEVSDETKQNEAKENIYDNQKFSNDHIDSEQLEDSKEYEDDFEDETLSVGHATPTLESKANDGRDKSTMNQEPNLVTITDENLTRDSIEVSQISKNISKDENTRDGSDHSLEIHIAESKEEKKPSSDRMDEKMSSFVAENVSSPCPTVDDKKVEKIEDNMKTTELSIFSGQDVQKEDIVEAKIEVNAEAKFVEYPQNYSKDIPMTEYEEKSTAEDLNDKDDSNNISIVNKNDIQTIGNEIEVSVKETNEEVKHSNITGKGLHISNSSINTLIISGAKYDPNCIKSKNDSAQNGATDSHNEFVLSEDDKSKTESKCSFRANEKESHSLQTQTISSQATQTSNSVQIQTISDMQTQTIHSASTQTVTTTESQTEKQRKMSVSSVDSFAVAEYAKQNACEIEMIDIATSPIPETLFIIAQKQSAPFVIDNNAFKQLEGNCENVFESEQIEIDIMKGTGETATSDTKAIVEDTELEADKNEYTEKSIPADEEILQSLQKEKCNEVKEETSSKKEVDTLQEKLRTDVPVENQVVTTESIGQRLKEEENETEHTEKSIPFHKEILQSLQREKCNEVKEETSSKIEVDTLQEKNRTDVSADDQVVTTESTGQRLKEEENETEHTENSIPSDKVILQSLQREKCNEVKEETSSKIEVDTLQEKPGTDEPVDDQVVSTESIRQRLKEEENETEHTEKCIPADKEILQSLQREMCNEVKEETSSKIEVDTLQEKPGTDVPVAGQVIATESTGLRLQEEENETEHTEKSIPADKEILQSLQKEKCNEVKEETSSIIEVETIQEKPGTDEPVDDQVVTTESIGQRLKEEENVTEITEKSIPADKEILQSLKSEMCNEVKEKPGTDVPVDDQVVTAESIGQRLTKEENRSKTAPKEYSTKISDSNEILEDSLNEEKINYVEEEYNDLVKKSEVKQDDRKQIIHNEERNVTPQDDKEKTLARVHDCVEKDKTLIEKANESSTTEVKENVDGEMGPVEENKTKGDRTEYLDVNLIQEEIHDKRDSNTRLADKIAFLRLEEDHVDPNNIRQKVTSTDLEINRAKQEKNKIEMIQTLEITSAEHICDTKDVLHVRSGIDYTEEKLSIETHSKNGDEIKMNETIEEVDMKNVSGSYLNDFQVTRENSVSVTEGICNQENLIELNDVEQAILNKEEYPLKGEKSNTEERCGDTGCENGLYIFGGEKGKITTELEVVEPSGEHDIQKNIEILEKAIAQDNKSEDELEISDDNLNTAKEEDLETQILSEDKPETRDENFIQEKNSLTMKTVYLQENRMTALSMNDESVLTEIDKTDKTGAVAKSEIDLLEYRENEIDIKEKREILTVNASDTTVAESPIANVSHIEDRIVQDDDRDRSDTKEITSIEEPSIKKQTDNPEVHLLPSSERTRKNETELTTEKIVERNISEIEDQATDLDMISDDTPVSNEDKIIETDNTESKEQAIEQENRHMKTEGITSIVIGEENSADEKIEIEQTKEPVALKSNDTVIITEEKICERNEINNWECHKTQEIGIWVDERVTANEEPSKTDGVVQEVITTREDCKRDNEINEEISTMDMEIVENGLSIQLEDGFESVEKGDGILDKKSSIEQTAYDQQLVNDELVKPSKISIDLKTISFEKKEILDKGSEDKIMRTGKYLLQPNEDSTCKIRADGNERTKEINQRDNLDIRTDTVKPLERVSEQSKDNETVSPDQDATPDITNKNINTTRIELKTEGEKVDIPDSSKDELLPIQLTDNIKNISLEDKNVGQEELIKAKKSETDEKNIIQGLDSTSDLSAANESLVMRTKMENESEIEETNTQEEVTAQGIKSSSYIVTTQTQMKKEGNEIDTTCKPNDGESNLEQPNQNDLVLDHKMLTPNGKLDNEVKEPDVNHKLNENNDLIQGLDNSQGLIIDDQLFPKKSERERQSHKAMSVTEDHAISFNATNDNITKEVEQGADASFDHEMSPKGENVSNLISEILNATLPSSSQTNQTVDSITELIQRTDEKEETENEVRDIISIGNETIRKESKLDDEIVCVSDIEGQAEKQRIHEDKTKEKVDLEKDSEINKEPKIPITEPTPHGRKENIVTLVNKDGDNNDNTSLQTVEKKECEEEKINVKVIDDNKKDIVQQQVNLDTSSNDISSEKDSSKVENVCEDVNKSQAVDTIEINEDIVTEISSDKVQNAEATDTHSQCNLEIEARKDHIEENNVEKGGHSSLSETEKGGEERIELPADKYVMSRGQDNARGPDFDVEFAENLSHVQVKDTVVQLQNEDTKDSENITKGALKGGDRKLKNIEETLEHKEISLDNESAAQEPVNVDQSDNNCGKVTVNEEIKHVVKLEEGNKRNEEINEKIEKKLQISEKIELLTNISQNGIQFNSSKNDNDEFYDNTIAETKNQETELNVNHKHEYVPQNDGLTSVEEYFQGNEYADKNDKIETSTTKENKIEDIDAPKNEIETEAEIVSRLMHETKILTTNEEISTKDGERRAETITFITNSNESEKRDCDANTLKKETHSSIERMLVNDMKNDDGSVMIVDLPTGSKDNDQTSFCRKNFDEVYTGNVVDSKTKDILEEQKSIVNKDSDNEQKSAIKQEENDKLENYVEQPPNIKGYIEAVIEKSIEEANLQSRDSETFFEDNNESQNLDTKQPDSTDSKTEQIVKDLDEEQNQTNQTDLISAEKRGTSNEETETYYSPASEPLDSLPAIVPSYFEDGTIESNQSDGSVRPCEVEKDNFEVKNLNENYQLYAGSSVISTKLQTEDRNTGKSQEVLTQGECLTENDKGLYVEKETLRDQNNYESDKAKHGETYGDLLLNEKEFESSDIQRTQNKINNKERASETFAINTEKTENEDTCPENKHKVTTAQTESEKSEESPSNSDELVTAEEDISLGNTELVMDSTSCGEKTRLQDTDDVQESNEVEARTATSGNDYVTVEVINVNENYNLEEVAKLNDQLCQFSEKKEIVHKVEFSYVKAGDKNDLYLEKDTILKTENVEINKIPTDQQSENDITEANETNENQGTDKSFKIKEGMRKIEKEELVTNVFTPSQRDNNSLFDKNDASSQNVSIESNETIETETHNQETDELYVKTAVFENDSRETETDDNKYNSELESNSLAESEPLPSVSQPSCDDSLDEQIVVELETEIKIEQNENFQVGTGYRIEEHKEATYDLVVCHAVSGSNEIEKEIEIEMKDASEKINDLNVENTLDELAQIQKASELQESNFEASLSIQETQESDNRKKESEYFEINIKNVEVHETFDQAESHRSLSEDDIKNVKTSMKERNNISEETVIQKSKENYEKVIKSSSEQNLQSPELLIYKPTIELNGKEEQTKCQDGTVDISQQVYTEKHLGMDEIGRSEVQVDSKHEDLLTNDREEIMTEEAVKQNSIIHEMKQIQKENNEGLTTKYSFAEENKATTCVEAQLNLEKTANKENKFGFQDQSQANGYDVTVLDKEQSDITKSLLDESFKSKTSEKIKEDSEPGKGINDTINESTFERAGRATDPEICENISKQTSEIENSQTSEDVYYNKSKTGFYSSSESSDQGTSITSSEYLTVSKTDATVDNTTISTAHDENSTDVTQTPAENDLQFHLDKPSVVEQEENTQEIDNRKNEKNYSDFQEKSNLMDIEISKNGIVSTTVDEKSCDNSQTSDSETLTNVSQLTRSNEPNQSIINSEYEISHFKEYDNCEKNIFETKVGKCEDKLDGTDNTNNISDSENIVDKSLIPKLDNAQNLIDETPNENMIISIKEGNQLDCDSDNQDTSQGISEISNSFEKERNEEGSMLQDKIALDGDIVTNYIDRDKVVETFSIDKEIEATNGQPLSSISESDGRESRSGNDTLLVSKMSAVSPEDHTHGCLESFPNQPMSVKKTENEMLDEPSKNVDKTLEFSKKSPGTEHPDDDQRIGKYVDDLNTVDDISHTNSTMTKASDNSDVTVEEQNKIKDRSSERYQSTTDQFEINTEILPREGDQKLIKILAPSEIDAQIRTRHELTETSVVSVPETLEKNYKNVNEDGIEKSDTQTEKEIETQNELKENTDMEETKSLKEVISDSKMSEVDVHVSITCITKKSLNLTENCEANALTGDEKEIAVIHVLTDQAINTQNTLNEGQTTTLEEVVNETKEKDVLEEPFIPKILEIVTEKSEKSNENDKKNRETQSNEIIKEQNELEENTNQNECSPEVGSINEISEVDVDESITPITKTAETHTDNTELSTPEVEVENANIHILNEQATDKQSNLTEAKTICIEDKRSSATDVETTENNVNLGVTNLPKTHENLTEDCKKTNENDKEICGKQSVTVIEEQSELKENTEMKEKTYSPDVASKEPINVDIADISITSSAQMPQRSTDNSEEFNMPADQNVTAMRIVLTDKVTPTENKLNEKQTTLIDVNKSIATEVVSETKEKHVLEIPSIPKTLETVTENSAKSNENDTNHCETQSNDIFKAQNELKENQNESSQEVGSTNDVSEEDVDESIKPITQTVQTITDNTVNDMSEVEQENYNINALNEQAKDKESNLKEVKAIGMENSRSSAPDYVKETTENDVDLEETNDSKTYEILTEDCKKPNEHYEEISKKQGVAILEAQNELKENTEMEENTCSPDVASENKISADVGDVLITSGTKTPQRISDSFEDFDMPADQKVAALKIVLTDKDAPTENKSKEKQTADLEINKCLAPEVISETKENYVLEVPSIPKTLEIFTENNEKSNESDKENSDPQGEEIIESQNELKYNTDLEQNKCSPEVGTENKAKEIDADDSITSIAKAPGKLTEPQEEYEISEAEKESALKLELLDQATDTRFEMKESETAGLEKNLNSSSEIVSDAKESVVLKVTSIPKKFDNPTEKHETQIMFENKSNNADKGNYKDSEKQYDDARNKEGKTDSTVLAKSTSSGEEASTNMEGTATLKFNASEKVVENIISKTLNSENLEPHEKTAVELSSNDVTPSITEQVSFLSHEIEGSKPIVEVSAIMDQSSILKDEKAIDEENLVEQISTMINANNAKPVIETGTINTDETDAANTIEKGYPLLLGPTAPLPAIPLSEEKTITDQSTISENKQETNEEKIDEQISTLIVSDKTSTEENIQISDTIMRKTNEERTEGKDKKTQSKLEDDKTIGTEKFDIVNPNGRNSDNNDKYGLLSKEIDIRIQNGVSARNNQKELESKAQGNLIVSVGESNGNQSSPETENEANDNTSATEPEDEHSEESLKDQTRQESSPGNFVSKCKVVEEGKGSLDKAMGAFAKEENSENNPKPVENITDQQTETFTNDIYDSELKAIEEVVSSVDKIADQIAVKERKDENGTKNVTEMKETLSSSELTANSGDSKNTDDTKTNSLSVVDPTLTQVTSESDSTPRSTSDDTSYTDTFETLSDGQTTAESRNNTSQTSGKTGSQHTKEITTAEPRRSSLSDLEELPLE